MARITIDQTGFDAEMIEGIFERKGYSVTVEEISFGTDSLCDWKAAARRWNSYSDSDEGKTSGFSYLLFENVQAIKGQARRDVFIVDLRTCRAVYGCDMEPSC